MTARNVIVHPVGTTTWAMTVDGEDLGSSRTPLLAAARILLQRGEAHETELTLQHRGSDVVAMRTTVGVAAGLTVWERDDGHARFETYRAHPNARGADAV
jgi:hypothetical protein